MADQKAVFVTNLRDEIAAWVAAGRLQPRDAVHALQIAGIVPDPAGWRRFAGMVLLWAGVLLTASGVIFFFAYNWNALSRMTRFGVAETIFAAAMLTAAWVGPSRAGGRAALLLASLLTGALLALFGQTYQTGADSYVLFTTWCVALLPWAVAARFAPLWLLCWALANTAIVTHFQATQWGLFDFSRGYASVSYLLLALNVASLAVWEAGAESGVIWLNRWGARIIGTAAAGIATFLGVTAIVEPEQVSAAAFFVYVILLAALFVYYRLLRLDIFMLSGGLLSAIFVSVTLLFRITESRGDSSNLLLIGFVILGMSAAGGAWIRNISRKAES